MTTLLELFSENWWELVSPYLELKTANGRVAVWSLDPGESWVGDCLTLNTSVWPNDASVSCLSDILETWEDWSARHPKGKPEDFAAYLAKYYLSPQACAGILLRAEKRGRQLPPLLQQALEHVARTITRPKQITSSPRRSRKTPTPTGPQKKAISSAKKSPQPSKAAQAQEAGHATTVRLLSQPSLEM